MKEIGILGSTGSVGKQALEVIKSHSDKFKVKYLAANTNAEILIEQAKKFNPEYVCLIDKNKSSLLKDELSNYKLLFGNEDLNDLCENIKPDIVLNAISGYHGLKPTINIIKSGIDIALSNKESIVQAGHIVMPLAKKNNVNIFPVDSEHSAIWQCLVGEKKTNIKNIILTASGGPFRSLEKNNFINITKEDALNHPNWSMGNKITIDSATMMNKGFEVIEAKWLFDIELEKIKIVVHPQSVIHSIVEFIDGSLKAQISIPDMRQPIQYAFSYPKRILLENMDFDFAKYSQISFEDVDYEKFKCIGLAYDAIKFGGSYCTVLNVSNDIAVQLFLEGKISFIDIPKIIEKTMAKHNFIKNPNLEEIKSTTEWTLSYIESEFPLL